MSNRGYTKAIGAIFSNWELVKDEILLPNRKAGSGNGTVHIYLLEDNMNMFRECFPDYIKKFNLSPESAEKDCPQIQHFVLTSNILTVAGFAYNHYRCDANVFNYSDYVNKVIKQDDKVDLLFDRVKKGIIELIAKDAANGEQATDLLMVAKYFERIGDHATNIAEWVLFSITGVHNS